MLKTLFSIVALITLITTAQAKDHGFNTPLPGLKNYQVNNSKMVSSGLPTKNHFEKLKSLGVNKVVDLIPGDRSEQRSLMNAMQLTYHNIAVEWENPTLENFQDYVAIMQQYEQSDGVILTHCRLNWRGAVFTYLYQVTHLKTPEEKAKQVMLAIWQPNETWQRFIDDILAQY